MSSSPFIICIDGLIGAGKSTLMKKLAREAGFACFPEPVSEWNLLSSFYENPKLYSLPFQIQVLISQFRQRQQFPSEGVAVVVERCPQTSYRVFAPLVLSSNDFAAYERLYERLAYRVDHFIYLDVDPQVAFRRIRNRSTVDSGISLDYLTRLHEQYAAATDLSPVTVVDANRPSDIVEREVTEIINDKINKLFH